MQFKSRTTRGTPIHCAFDELVDVAVLVPNPRNPNRHPQRQVELLAKIIAHQGWRAPITVSRRSGFVVRGHGRLQAALLLGETDVPVDYQDYACEADEWADLIADNRIAELAEMDEAALRELLRELEAGAVDLDLTGYAGDDLDRLLADAGPQMGSLKDLSDYGERDVEQLTIVVHVGQAEDLRRRLKEIARHNPDPEDPAPLGWALEQAIAAYERSRRGKH